jgi:tRNA nucleotidyltransferase (CCA-adding enzyme)
MTKVYTGNMEIAFGHTNSDLDCLASLILVKKLYPGVRLVRSGVIHPSATHLHTLYAPWFNWINPKDLEGEHIDRIIIVDTCLAERVQEYFNHIRGSDPEIIVFDHHILENCNIQGALLAGSSCGANTSQLALRAKQADISLSPEEATIALSGIYADTGRLLYESVTPDDYEAASWLLQQGALLNLVKSFLEPVQEEEQVAVMNELLPGLEMRNIQGHIIMTSFLDLEHNIPGLAAVVEQIMEVKNPDAYFAFFSVAGKKQGAPSVLLIARSRKDKIDLHELLSLYGGGGHRLAASAHISGRDGRKFMEEFCSGLEQSLAPATRAGDIMTTNVVTIHSGSSLIDASMLLERVNLTGAPVVDNEGAVSGFISLRDIMKGRKNNAMKAPVTAYMSKPIVFCKRSATMREVERLFFKHHIGRLPVVESDKLLGIVSRQDYLAYREGKSYL